MVSINHINIVSISWRNLSKFYIDVFDFKPEEPPRVISGEWLSKGTGVANASLEGVRLFLDKSDFFLEIYQYSTVLENQDFRVNQKGLSHICFSVIDINKYISRILKNGGNAVGELSANNKIRFIFMKDPENNLVELVEKFN